MGQTVSQYDSKAFLQKHHVEMQLFHTILHNLPLKERYDTATQDLERASVAILAMFSHVRPRPDAFHREEELNLLVCFGAQLGLSKELYAEVHRQYEEQLLEAQFIQGSFEA